MKPTETNYVTYKSTKETTYVKSVYFQVPRAILADLEPGTIDSVKAGSMGRQFRYHFMNLQSSCVI